MTARTWARRFATGLSSLRDRAANLRRRLAALRFNPSRAVGYALLAAPFFVVWAFALLYLPLLPALSIILGPLAFLAWIGLAVTLTMR